MMRTTGLSRRSLLGWSAATALAGVTALDTPWKTSRHLGSWNPAVSELDKLLREQHRKHVIAYALSTSQPVIDLYRHSDLWQMLASNGFTDYFVEAPAGEQANIVEAGQQMLGQSMGPVKSRIYYQARQQGLTTTAIDLYGKPSDTEYSDRIAEIWKSHKEADGRSYTATQIVQEIDDQAQFMRTNFLHTPYFSDLRADALNGMRKSREDQSTATYSTDLAKQAKGKIWQTEDMRCLPNCTIHTGVKDRLILEIYAGRYEMLKVAAKRKNNDVFIDYSATTIPSRRYALLLASAEIAERGPIEPSNLSDFETCQRDLSHTEAMTTGFDEFYIESTPLHHHRPSVRQASHPTISRRPK